MTIRRFCLMTEGRSGSTSLMEALEVHKDIAVPNRNIKCPDNEIIHPKHWQKYAKQYAKLVGHAIETPDDLIDAFFEYNVDPAFNYAGFKSMPNRHENLAQFVARDDIRFITLRRRDIVSTVASFQLAMRKGTWRRHGEEVADSWTFDPAVDAESVRGNIAYVHETHTQLDSIPDAISLCYEDLCDPDYTNAALNEFFMRRIGIQDPRPPTSAATYVTNWEEFRAFVESVLAGLGASKSGQAPGESAVKSRGADSTPRETATADTSSTAAELLSTLRTYCQFIGYPNAGATLMMAALNAHPDVLVGHRTGVVEKLVSGELGLKQAVGIHAKSLTRFLAEGATDNGKDLKVKGQWQGRLRQLLVDADDNATLATRVLAENPDGLQTRLELPVRYLHCFRNPYDTIVALQKTIKGNLDEAISAYLKMLATVESVRASAGAEAFHDMCLEELIGEPHRVLRETCEFLGLESPQDYLVAARAVIFSNLPTLRDKVTWTRAQIDRVTAAIEKVPALTRYQAEREQPRPDLAPAPPLKDSSPQTAPSRAGQPGQNPRTGKGSAITVVYAWELGMDLGHIMRFLPLAQALRQRGVEVVFAVRDLKHAESVIAKQGFRVVQAPIWQDFPKNLRNPPLNYAEIIVRYGFLNAQGLTGLVRAWRYLYQMTGASMVIADHAPSALLAARTLGMKQATIGHGFFTPPAGVNPTPNMRPWLKVPDKRLQTSDALVLANANAVIKGLGGNPLSMIADLFRVDAEFICTFPELDHYADRQGAQYWGAAYNIEEGVDAEWPAGEGKRIFAYLKPNWPDFEPLMKALAASDARVIAYVSGVSPKQAEKYRTDRLHIVTQPARLAKLRQECDLAICHGGIGTVAALLLAGKPQLLLPTQLEQYLLSRRVEEVGAALIVNLDKSEEKAVAGKSDDKKKQEKPVKPDYSRILTRLLQEPAFTEAAQSYAEKYKDFDLDKQYQAMAATVTSILASARRTPAGRRAGAGGGRRRARSGG